MSELRRERASLVALALFTLAVGALRFANDFVYDDIQLLVQSRFVYDWTNVPALFVNNTMFAADGGAYAQTAVVDTYRPLTMLTFFVDGAVGGGAPWAFHLSNQLGHLAVVLLLWQGLRRQLPTAPRGAALAASLAFAVHPLLAEAHVWINGRSDIWAGVFAAVVLWAWPRDGGTALRWAAIGAALFAGMLCKEVVLFVIPAMLIWTQVGASRGTSVRAPLLAAGAASVCAVVAYLLARSLALGGVKAGSGSLSLAEVALRVPVMWWDGLLSLLVPRTLMMRHLSEDYASIGGVVSVAAAIGALVLGGAALASLRRAPAIGVGLGWYAATLAPATLIAFTPGWVGFGRYIYLPAMGLAFAAVGAAAAVRDRGWLQRAGARYASLGLGAWIVGLALLSTVVTLNYRNNLAFYSAIAEEQPERAHGHRGVGESLHALGQLEAAVVALDRAIALEPRLRTPHVNRTMALAQLGRFEAAEASALAGLSLHAADANLWQLLSLARLERGSGDATTPLLRAAQLAGAAPWLVGYAEHFGRRASTERATEAARLLDGVDPTLADGVRRAAAARP
jgi:protein O-mannosyl-transferase